jgi:acetyl esterase
MKIKNHSFTKCAIFVTATCCAFGFFVDSAFGQQSTSEKQFQELLKFDPDAGPNGNGKLTPVKTLAYQATVKQQRAQNVRRQEQGTAKPTHKNVSYGDHKRNVLDLYLADSKTPTPLLIYIHGGGFVAGDKNSLNAVAIDAAKREGISIASLNYRFVDGKDIIFPAPQHDCARAVQFLRSNADKWNLDPKKFACFGGSAGAGISMWIGFHDDLADPDSDDPVKRQSTRIVAVGTMGGQGTYDPIKIKQLVGGRAWEHPSIFKVYGIQSAKEALSPSKEMQSLYDESSAITHLTKDDPPLFMIYSEPDIVPPADSKPGEFIHHPNFGKQLKKKMDELGIENIYVHTDDADGRNPVMEMFAFFKKHFNETK